MPHADKGTVTLNSAGTAYGTVQSLPPDANRLALAVQVGGGAGTATVTLQGSLDGVTWYDTALTASTLAANAGQQITPSGTDGGIIPVWRRYRVKVEAIGGAQTVNWRLVGVR